MLRNSQLFVCSLVPMEVVNLFNLFSIASNVPIATQVIVELFKATLPHPSNKLKNELFLHKLLRASLLEPLQLFISVHCYKYSGTVISHQAAWPCEPWDACPEH